MSQSESVRNTRRDKAFRPAPPLRPREFYSYRPQRAWYNTLVAYLVPVIVLTVLAVYYFGQ